MTSLEKVNKIKELMKKDGINAYIIPNSDPHISEYIPDFYRFRTFVSGFTGSAGTVVIGEEKSGLWTDGRYFVQAEQQIAGSSIELYRMAEPGVPTIPEFLAQELPQGGVIGFDGNLVSAKEVADYLAAGKAKGLTLKTDLDYASILWDDGSRPALPNAEVYPYEFKYTGEEAKDKIERLRKRTGGQANLITRLDSVAWLYNVRGMDIPMIPTPLAFALVTNTEAYMFTEMSRVNDAAKAYLKENGIQLMDYADAAKVVASISEKTEMRYEEAVTNYNIFKAMEENPNITPVVAGDEVTLMKACKNKVEIENIANAQIKDGRAMVEAVMEIERRMAAGERTTELDVSNILLECRMKQPLCTGASFTSIIATKANAAMMHYAPTEENCAVLQPEGMLLMDCGGQFLDGTVDITRTIALGPVPQSQKEEFTAVVCAMISLAKVKFLGGTIGTQLDIMARHKIWERCIDYRCGTGHGVGAFLSVHEGPHAIRKNVVNVPMQEGMIVTDEPGIYTEGSHGIRIENMLVVEHEETNEYGEFFHFRNLAAFPIDTSLIIKDQMEKSEIEWLNNFHKWVYEVLAPGLNEEQKQWLAEKTKAI
jgi:Xaa-Pro aminopeptidase